MRRAFTLLEVLLAIMLLGMVTALSLMTFGTISRQWEMATDYLDKLQHSDYALNQVVAGLRSMYYPHAGEQDAHYGFVLVNNGDGEDPDSSDVIEWSKKGTAIVGNRSAVADTVHRVQVMILEEGNNDYNEPIAVTGLYARQCPDATLRPEDDDVDYTFGNDEMYQPVLISPGIVGFNCRVLKTDEKVESENDDKLFEDEFDASNSVPYKLELTFYMEDPEAKSYRTNTAPVMRIVRIPVFEQSQDGAKTPGEEGDANSKDRRSRDRLPPGARPPAGGGTGGGKGGGAGGSTGPKPPAGGGSSGGGGGISRGGGLGGGGISRGGAPGGGLGGGGLR